MTCGQFGSLEIGNNQFWAMTSEPQITDTLGARGETCRVQIRCNRGGPYPQLGALAAIVRDGVKEFGGRFIDEPVKFQTNKEIYDLTLANYLGYTQRKSISNYSLKNTLKGHALAGIQLGGAFDGARPLNLLAVDVLGDSNAFFNFAFKGPGTLQKFLDDLTARANATWTIHDGGWLSVGNLTTGVVARIVITVNGTAAQPAPETQLRVQQPGEQICRDTTFYFDLSETEGSYPYSVYTIIGRNGMNRPADGTLSHNDLLTLVAQDGQTSYETLSNPDQLLTVEVVTP